MNNRNEAQNIKDEGLKKELITSSPVEVNYLFTNFSDDGLSVILRI